MPTALPLSTSNRSPIDVARECAAQAATIVRGVWGQDHAVGSKGPRNPVTETDVAVERAVRDILQREYPAHLLMGEETSSDAWSDDWMWVVDPIDGTRNFSRGIPHIGFNLALCLGGEPVVGLTTHPLTGDEFLAVQGLGTTLNGRQVRVNGDAPLSETILALDLGLEDVAAQAQLRTANALWQRVLGVRIGASAALGLAYLAAGKWDAYIHVILAPWDSAPGLLLVREAGGVVTELDGSPATLRSTAVVAGTPANHAAILDEAQRQHLASAR
ncbi:MAG: inositol monophosphatase family protein [Dehalococcoidia bacterium]